MDLEPKAEQQAFNEVFDRLAVYPKDGDNLNVAGYLADLRLLQSLGGEDQRVKDYFGGIGESFPPQQLEKLRRTLYTELKAQEEALGRGGGSIGALKADLELAKLITLGEAARPNTQAYLDAVEAKYLPLPQMGQNEKVAPEAVPLEDPQYEALKALRKRTEPPFWMDPDVPVGVKLGEEIGVGGSVGKVYQAEIVVEGRPPVTVAVKMLRNEAGKDGLGAKEHRVRLEERVLSILRQKHAELFPNSPSPFPFSRLVEVWNREVGRMVPAIVLEYLPKERSVEGMYRAQKLSPQSLRSMLEQYTELVITMRAVGLYVGDRKDRDLYYFSDEDRLVVSDWNIAEEVGLANFDKPQIDEGLNMFLGVGVAPKCSMRSLKSFWDILDYQKLEALHQRLGRVEDATTAEMALELIRGLRTLPLSVYETSYTTEFSLTEAQRSAWELSIADQGLRRTLQSLVDRGEVYSSEIRADEIKSLEKNGQIPQVYKDLVKFIFDLAEFSFKTKKDSNLAKTVFTKEWRQGFLGSAIRLLTGTATDPQASIKTLIELVEKLVAVPVIADEFMPQSGKLLESVLAAIPG